MTELKDSRQRENERRRDLGIFFLILPLAIACMFCAGQRAIALQTPWSVNASMRSDLDANKDYLTKRSSGVFIEPISADILTLPAWFILTPVTGESTLSPNSTLPPASTSAATSASTSAATSAVTFVPPTLPSGGGGGGSKPKADLQITKTDGSSIYNPGSPAVYTIVVSNLSATTNVNNATVTDNFAAALGGINWSCAGIGGATCSPNNGTSNINNTVNLPPGSSVTYVVGSTVSLSASGNLINTAVVTAPAGINDPTPANNSATDVDTNGPVLFADLQITKTDSSSTYDVGGSITYTITVSNPSGPGNISGATVADTFPAALSSISWTCSGLNGGTCASGPIAGNINDTVNLPITGSITYTVTADVSLSASGNLSNTATVSMPGGYTDPTPGNNSATDTDTPSYNVDLHVTKDDSVATYTPGSFVTYSIVVTNTGILDATGAVITDSIPAQVSLWSWACTTVSGGATGCDPVINSTTGFSDTVNLPIGGSITYTVTANTYSSAAVNLVNTASIAAPIGFTDTDLSNNSSTDTDTASLSGDLSITKDDSVTTYSPGGSVTYSIVVSNAGPSDAVNASVADLIPSQISSWDWACSGSTGGATGCDPAASNSANFSDTVNLPSGSSITYTVTANIDTAATGNLLNTATVAAPGGYTDTNSANDTVTDTDNLIADLGITKTSATNQYAASSAKMYTIVVSNAGPSDVVGAIVNDTFSTNTNIASASWTCVATGLATCSASGSGDISDTINIPVGQTATYSVTANIVASPTGLLVNTAYVTKPAGYNDPDNSNNSATNSAGLYTYLPSGNIGTGKDGAIGAVGTGGTLTFTLSSPILVGSHAGDDLIYYEEPSGIGILMDQVVLQIGDGVNWYTILNWGDGLADTNTNISIPLPSPIPNPTDCSGEPDNCPIDGSLLNLTSGITIEVDGLGIPNGSYPYIRITDPGTGDGIGLDGFYVIP